MLNEDKVRNLWCYENQTDKQIAEQFNCSAATVKRFRDKNNIIRLYQDKEWLKLKIDEGLNASQIARLINCNPSTVERALNNYGIVLSKTKNTYNYNENAFAVVNEESAYWAGFIMADGHIESYMRYGSNVANLKVKITLSNKDIDHLHKFNKFLGDNIKIHDNKVTLRGKEHIMSTIKVANKKLCNDLINVFSIPLKDKSCNELIPNIPKEYIPHFIRGYFDGDGSVMITKNKLQITLLGGEDFLKQVRSFINVGYIRKDTYSKVFRLEIYSKDECKQFLEYIYNNHSICLDRKFEKYNNNKDLLTYKRIS